MLALALLLAGCDKENLFTVDASALAVDHPDAVLRVQLIHYGELDEGAELDFAQGQTTFTFETMLQVGIQYGVAAYADLDLDGHCQPTPTDLPWLFTYLPAYGTDFVWVPDPSESDDAFVACSWFGDIVDDGSPDAPL